MAEMRGTNSSLAGSRIARISTGHRIARASIAHFRTRRDQRRITYSSKIAKLTLAVDLGQQHSKVDSCLTRHASSASLSCTVLMKNPLHTPSQYHTSHSTGSVEVKWHSADDTARSTAHRIGGPTCPRNPPKSALLSCCLRSKQSPGSRTLSAEISPRKEVSSVSSASEIADVEHHIPAGSSSCAT
eukprot:3326652-Rhodomonas_salina.4